VTDSQQKRQRASAAAVTEQAASLSDVMPRAKTPSLKQHWSLLGSLLFALIVAMGLLFALRSPEGLRTMRLPEPEPRPVLLDTPPMSPQPARVRAPARRD
jgi:hypothetical protein